MQKFEFIRQPLLGELEMSWREREIMPFIVATYVYASSQAQHTHSARTNNNKQFISKVIYNKTGGNTQSQAVYQLPTSLLQYFTGSQLHTYHKFLRPPCLRDWSNKELGCLGIFSVFQLVPLNLFFTLLEFGFSFWDKPVPVR